jgi:hypothetical protein
MAANENNPTNGLRKAALLVFAPFLALFGGLIILSNRIFFAWWLDKRIAKKEQEEFTREIRKNLPFLFANYGAQVIPHDRPYPLVADYTVILVAIDSIRFRFVRGRGEFRVDVARHNTPNDWQEVSSVISQIGAADGSRSVQSYYRLKDFGRLLGPNLDRLKEGSDFS